MPPSFLLKWGVGDAEDSLQNKTNNLDVSQESITENTTTTTSTTALPDFTGNWDKTLTWDNSLNQLKLLKSIGDGNESRLIQSPLIIIPREEPVQLDNWMRFAQV